MNIPQTDINKQPHAERAYLHTLVAGAVLPFIQASIMALVVTIVVWVIAWAVFDAVDPQKPAFLFGGVMWIWWMWKFISHWLRLTTIENVIRDFADDGKLNNSYQQPEAQEEPMKVIRIQLVKENGHISSTINLPGDRESLGILARGLLNGMPFSEKMWTGAGKPFSSNTFRALRDVMRANDLAEYINEADPRAGIRLTDAGRAVMENLASPHSPSDEDEA